MKNLKDMEGYISENSVSERGHFSVSPLHVSKFEPLITEIATLRETGECL